MNNQKRPIIYVVTQAATAMILLGGMSCMAHAAGDEATVTVTGSVTANTCVMEEKSFDAPLGPIADRDIQGVNNIGSVSKAVTITLTGCGAEVTTVKVTASSKVPEGDGHYFPNTAVTADKPATGVGIMFYETDGLTAFDANGSTTEISSLKSPKTELTYTAKYIGTAATVTAGAVKTSIDMKLEYQ